jgi:hypothetical protein
MARIEKFEDLVSWQKARQLIALDEGYVSEAQFQERTASRLRLVV